jgi:hypothetical protein
MKHGQENTETLLILVTLAHSLWTYSEAHRWPTSRTGLGNLWHAERFPWNAAFTAVPIYFYLFCPTGVSMMWRMCVYTYLTAYRLYMNYRWYRITLRVKYFYTIGSGAKCWLDNYHWGADLAVTGRKDDIGQNVLRASFQEEVVAAIPRGGLYYKCNYTRH